MREEWYMHGYSWLALPVLVVLQMFVLPVFIGTTYASKNPNPEHTLIYNDHRVSWGAGTSVNKDGIASLEFFDTSYKGVRSEDGENVIAPGTERETVIRLQNKSANDITYKAVFYKTGSDDIPINVCIMGSNLSEEESINLPDNIEGNLIKAVSGEIKGERVTEFDVQWSWDFEGIRGSSQTNESDTLLGNSVETLEDLGLGLYIVVYDDNDVVTTKPPKTSDDSDLLLYLIATLVSGLILTVYISRRRIGGASSEA